MKKLGRFKLNENAAVLSDQEMKMVKGGYGGYCYEGERLYQCLVYWYGGGSFTGGACGMTSGDAENRVKETLKNQGFGVGGDISLIYCQ